MKNTTRLVSLLLVLAMCLCLCACGGSGNKDEESPAVSGSDIPTPAADLPSSGSDIPAATAPASDSDIYADSDTSYILENGKMVIGYTVYEPMNYTDDDGNFTGFDTELAEMVCNKLGIKAEFVIINWDTKEVALEAKDIDCIWNGLTLDADREANMACTIPYVKNAQVVVMKSGSDYTDTNSLSGKTVCAELGSAGEDLIKGDDADPGLSKASFVGKSIQTDCLMEVKAGTADAAVLDMTLAKSMTGEGTNYSDLEIVDYLSEEAYGVAFRKGSDMRDLVNVLFEDMRKDGSLQELADKYGLELAD